MLLKMLIWQVYLQWGSCFPADTLNTDLNETRAMSFCMPSPEMCLPSPVPHCGLLVPASPALSYFCQQMDPEDE